MDRLGRSAKTGLRSLGDFVWPHRSLLTGQTHAGQGLIPPADFMQLSFLNGSGCRLCAMPAESDLGEATMCGACAANPPPWQAARAALEYDEASRKAVLDLKRAGRREGLPVFASWMGLAGADLLSAADLIVPVPLHYRRLASRGFNQSGWLATGLARRTGIAACNDALVRRKPTPSQGGLSARERRRNVRGAFAIRPSRAEQVEGARVVLVDDVYTTGATLSSCTRALIRGKAASVSVLVLARVVRPTDVTI